MIRVVEMACCRALLCYVVIRALCCVWHMLLCYCVSLCVAFVVLRDGALCVVVRSAGCFILCGLIHMRCCFR